MKTFKLLLLLIFVATISCKEEKPKVILNKNNKKVVHYVCKNNCENSGSATEGICPTCNNPYIHNQAFHNDDFLKNGPLNVPKNNQGTKAPTNNTQSPVQNVKGVFHYTCSNGCYGGAGTGVNCNTCGAALTHNQAYHN